MLLGDVVELCGRVHKPKSVVLVAKKVRQPRSSNVALDRHRCFPVICPWRNLEFALNSGQLCDLMLGFASISAASSSHRSSKVDVRLTPSERVERSQDPDVVWELKFGGLLPLSPFEHQPGGDRRCCVGYGEDRIVDSLHCNQVIEHILRGLI